MAVCAHCAPTLVRSESLSFHSTIIAGVVVGVLVRVSGGVRGKLHGLWAACARVSL